MIAYHGDELFCDGHKIRWLADRLSTPFFLFSERALAENYRRLAQPLSELPAGGCVDYCVKTNHELALLHLIRGLGAGATVSCGWELELALAAGFDPARITFHGPCKTGQELDRAVSVGVGLIHVYSPEEVDELNRVAGARRRRMDVSFRLPTPGPRWRRGPAGWYAQRLGIPWKGAARLAHQASTLPWVRPVGFSVHLGTHMIHPAPYRKAVRRLVRLAQELSDSGSPSLMIGLGGGWPSNTLQPLRLKTLIGGTAVKDSPPTLPAAATLIREVAAAFRAEIEHSQLAAPPLLRLEPGRGIVGSSGLLVTRVRALRGRWVFVDGSRNYLPETLVTSRRLILPSARRSGDPLRRSHISGQTLNTMDILALGVRLPALRVGDVLAFLDAGAYSLSRACRYAGTIPAAYLITEAGKVVQILKGDRYADLVAPMVPPDQWASVLD
jgi:diaminopimelate decarboxylase